jgi:hypothetical protein
MVPPCSVATPVATNVLGRVSAPWMVGLSLAIHSLFSTTFTALRMAAFQPFASRSELSCVASPLPWRRISTPDVGPGVVIHGGPPCSDLALREATSLTPKIEKLGPRGPQTTRFLDGVMQAASFSSHSDSLGVPPRPHRPLHSVGSPPPTLSGWACPAGAGMVYVWEH